MNDFGLAQYHATDIGFQRPDKCLVLLSHASIVMSSRAKQSMDKEFPIAGRLGGRYAKGGFGGSCRLPSWVAPPSNAGSRRPPRSLSSPLESP